MILNISLYSAIINSPIGCLGIKTANNQLTHIEFLPAKTKLIQPREHLAKRITKELEKYFADANYRFSILLPAQGTIFQQRVWQEMQKIPAGKTKSYGEVADKLKSSARAVGNACRSNPIPIIIPCHRIVAKNGLGGYSGATQGKLLNIKEWLLNHEEII